MENFENENKITSNGVVFSKPRREIVLEDLQVEFDRQLDKIDLINDFMALFGKKKEIKGDLTFLKNKTVELKNFLHTAREQIEIFKKVQLPHAQSLIEGMRKQNLNMLNMLEGMDDNSEKYSCASSASGNFK